MDALLPVPAIDVVASTATTEYLTNGVSVYGTLDAAYDRDWYKIQVFAGLSYDFRLLGVGYTPVADPLLRLRDQSGGVLVTVDDAGGAFGNNAVARYTATYNGYIYVDAGAAGSNTGDFLLTATTERYVGTPVLSADEVAWQLTNNFERYFNDAGDNNVPATAYDLSAGRTLTYNITQLSTAGKALAVQAMTMWSDVIGVRFVATTGTAQLRFDDSETGTSAYNNNTVNADGTIVGSNVMITNGWLAEFGTTLNSYSFETTIHEVGHALGLGHGGNYNGSATYAVDNYYANDSQHLSIMSYMQANFDEFARDSVDYNRYSNAQFRWVLTPMIADILAMSHLYGLSTTTRTGDTTYGYNANTGNTALDAAISLNDPAHNNFVAFTIFDNGGIDTVDMSGFGSRQRIDLHEGASSDVLGGRLNMGIAYGTVVENAYGGVSHDEINGNDSNNLLRGMAGNDSVYGYGGNDIMDGGQGADSLFGGDGDDTFIVSDTLIFNDSSVRDGFFGDNGTDTLDLTNYINTTRGFVVDLTAQTLVWGGSSVARVQNVENVRGTDFGDTMTGDIGGNVLNGFAGNDSIDGGRGNDTLEGGAGRDTLVGGNGNDVYFAAEGDTIVEDATAGTDKVYSSTNFALSANLESLTLLGTAAINGSGNAGANLIIGNNAANSLFGGAGADTLLGGAGNDRLNGETFAAGFDTAAAQVYRLYLAVLNRVSDPVGQMNWTNRIASGALSLQQAANSFVASAEFQRNYGATSNEAFVTLLYDHVLNRLPDSSGLANWTNALNSGRMTRAEVVIGFSESAEFSNTTAAEVLGVSRAGLQADWADDVYRLYGATLDRAPDVAGLITWTTALAQGRSLLSVVEGFTASREFVAHYGATNNTDFVTLLYRNVLDRAPDLQGLAMWTGRLENGTMTRSEVVCSFANSAEFLRATASELGNFMRMQLRDDQLEAGAGDTLLFGGLGTDSFVFDRTDVGNHRVADLEAWDRIDLQDFGYETSAETRAHFAQVGDDMVFTDRGVTVTFVNTALSAITDAMLVM